VVARAPARVRAPTSIAVLRLTRPEPVFRSTTVRRSIAWRRPHRARRKQIHNSLVRELPVDKSLVYTVLAACAVADRRPQTLTVSSGPAWPMPCGRRSRPTMPNGMRLAAPPLNLWLTVPIVARRPPRLDSPRPARSGALRCPASPGWSSVVPRPPSRRTSPTSRGGWVAGGGRETEAGLGSTKDRHGRGARRGITGRRHGSGRLACALVGMPDEPPRPMRSGSWPPSAPTCRPSPPGGGPGRASGEGPGRPVARLRTRPLVHPPFGLSTAAVFGELRPTTGPAPWGAGRNDLRLPPAASARSWRTSCAW
jgi:hypothetical protein